MSKWTHFRKKVFGSGHSSGPTVVKAPDAQMQTVEQGKGLTNIKQQQGVLSTLMGGGKSYIEDRPTTNAYAMTGKEYANDKAEFLATNTVKEKDYSKKALNALAVGAAANPAISKTLNSAIKDVKNIGAKLGFGHKHDSKRKLEQIRQNTANKIDNTVTLATQTSDDTQGTSKKNKKQQTTSQFLGM